MLESLVLILYTEEVRAWNKYVSQLMWLHNVNTESV